MSNKIEQGIADIIKKELKVDYLKKEAVAKILHYLDSQGVVRKVEAGFPQFQTRLTERANAELMVKQGWTRTERLISS